MRIGRAIVLGAVALAWSAPALAHDGGADLAALEKELDEQQAALQISDCQLACRALASIKRAADRICALEPGPRCEAARTKEADASRRVRDACPDCAVASPPTQSHQTAEVAAAPPKLASDSAPGGCRSCAATEGRTEPGDLGVFVLSVLAVAWMCRRRR